MGNENTNNTGDDSIDMCVKNIIPIDLFTNLGFEDVGIPNGFEYGRSTYFLPPPEQNGTRHSHVYANSADMHKHMYLLDAGEECMELIWKYHVKPDLIKMGWPINEPSN